jgi:uncharacterized membrane protein YgdD (TMEM256/DUF423 family)
MHAPSTRPETMRARGWLAANGAVCAAAAVALSAYAVHAAEGPAQARLQTAAIFAFGHGLALALLAPATHRRLGRCALLALYLGVLLFCGSLVFNALAQWPTTLAPLGGMLLIGGWLLLAIDLLRG